MATKANRLKKNLEKLQQQGGVITNQIRHTRLHLYKHLSEIYFWWVEASQQGTYLENEYQKLGRRFRAVNYGINFSPLIWLIYGHDGGLNSTDVDRFSRTLNAMHNEVCKKPDYYAKDGLAKLASFIQVSGGITTLSGYAPPDQEASVGTNIGNNEQLQQMQSQELLKQSWILGEFKIDTQPAVQYQSYFNTTHDDFAVLLVKRTAHGFEIVDADGDASTVNPRLENVLRKRFDLCVFSIRPILELIYTQCLPQALEGFAEKLVDVATLQNDKKRKKVTCHRRVFYRVDTKELILSPMNAVSGVVSVVKPNFDLLLDGCETDVYMPYTERNLIEKNLLRNLEFNLYDTELKQVPIPAYPELDSASYVVHLRHRTDSNAFQNISFWPFYNTLEQPQDQLLNKPDYQLTPTWHAHIDRDEIKRVSDVFLNNWLTGHARYLKRDAHALLKFTFADTWIAVEFVNDDGLFVNRQKIALQPISVSSNTVTAIFRTKDIVPVLNCLAVLPIIKKSEPVNVDDLFDDADEVVTTTEGYHLSVVDMDDGYRGGLQFDLDDHVLRIHFYTDGIGGVEHTIYVPTADPLGNPAEQAFYRYTPKVTVDDTKDTELATDDDVLPVLVEVEQ